MSELRIRELSGGFVLYFETPERVINAYALASALVNLADAAKAASRTLNAGVEIEIVVEAISGGSFKARIAAIARESGLFAKQGVASIILSVLANFIYEHTLAKNPQMTVEVLTDEVLVRQGDNTIIIPREVHEATQQVAQNPIFVKSVDRMMSGIITDTRVTGLGLTPSIDSPPPAVILSRQLLEIRDIPPELEEPSRIVEEDCDLYIVKAIMERSKRKWEFKWHGLNISAAIKDPSFYDDFASHNFTIAPGDEFQAKLAIHQRRDDVSGIYSNKSYEVLNVYRHVSHPKLRNANLHNSQK